MPYVGGSLTTLFDAAAQALTAAAAKKMAEEGGDHVMSVTRMNTPVRSGELRASWKRSPVAPEPTVDGAGWHTAVSTDVSYAPFVEHGTGLFGPKHAPYIIKPKNPGGTLRFVVDGRIMFAKEVLHPGSPGNHMLEIGMLVTQAAMEGGELFHATLEEWARGVEAGAR